MPSLGSSQVGTGAPSSGYYTVDGSVIDFPNSPTNGQTFSKNGSFWKYNGTYWESTTFSQIEYVGSREADISLTQNQGATKVAMDTQVSDPCGLWVAGTDVFIINERAGAGIYMIGVRGAKSGTGQCIFSLVSTVGPTMELSSHLMSSGTERGPSTLVYLPQGATFYLAVRENNVGTATLLYAYVQITKLQVDRDL